MKEETNSFCESPFKNKGTLPRKLPHRSHCVSLCLLPFLEPVDMPDRLDCYNWFIEISIYSRGRSRHLYRIGWDFQREGGVGRKEQWPGLTYFVFALRLKVSLCLSYLGSRAFPHHSLFQPHGLLSVPQINISPSHFKPFASCFSWNSPSPVLFVGGHYLSFRSQIKCHFLSDS